MTQVLKNKKGVTLVELLAVIVIMGIIAAIAVPAIGGLIENSEKKAAETEYANLLDAARLYATVEEDNAFLLSSLSPNYMDLTGVTTGTIWVRVSGTTVSFWDAETGGSAVTTIVINTYNISTETGKVS